VLRAKITRPDLPAWAVTRPRIDKLISEGVRGPLTSLTGPPGAGKTMAIVAWATSTRDPCTVAWLSVDDYDNRPRVFWPYVVAALRLAGIAVPRVMSGQSRAAVDHVFLARLASVLAAQDLPVVMVLDDLHLLTEPALLDGISHLLRNAGSSLHLVVASRADPLLPLHRYRVAGQLTEVRADDLAFNGQESGLLMAHHGVTLAAPMLECITGRTEGWAAGMRLAALSLQTRDDAEQFVKELGTGDSEITSYLVEEVLNTQPAPVRDMLLRTSVLDSFSADLACELTDDPRWVDALPALARANAFVRPLGQGWYRYHSLFATVLRLKLRIECREQLTDLYQRAARWCQRNGRLGEAVRYAAESGDWPFAAGMVVDEFAVGQLIEPRGHQPLAEAFKDMPRDKTWTQPEPLLVQAATRLCRGGGEANAGPLDAAESIIEHLPADHVPARLAAALIRLALARRTGDFEAAMAASGRAQALAGQLPGEVHASHPEVQAQVLAARGVMELWAGRLDEAAVSLAEGAAVSGFQAAHERAGCLGYLAIAEALDGRLSRATEWAERAAQEMSRGSDDLTEHLISGAAVALAWVCLQQGEMREAHVQLKLAETALRTCPDKLVSALACVVAAERGVAGGQARAAVEMIRRAREEWSPSPPSWLEVKLAILESRAWTAAGDAPAAVAAAQRAGSGPEAAAALAHARLAAGDELAARRVLGTEVPESLALGVALADARLSYGIGDGARGRRCLERALRLAKPERVRLPFAMERTWLRPVLRRDPDLAGAYHELLEPDMINPGMVPLQKKLSLPAQATPLVVERLSAREREVLTHASGMLSTAEIATEMYLSVNTVKTHLRSIYRKLSASHRSEAVRRAQQLQLL
jgi:LuxR family maltose regulon positive regulatory protein